MTIRVKVALFGTLALAAAVALYQPASAQPPDRGPLQHQRMQPKPLQPPPDGEDPAKRHRRFDSDRKSTASVAAYRDFMLRELQNVPTLRSHMLKLIELQQKKTTFQEERAAAGEGNRGDRRDALDKFHGSLRKEENLNQMIRQETKALMEQGGKVKAELKARRDSLTSRIAELKVDDGDASSSAELRGLGRTLRFYEYMDKRFSDLQDNPQRLDLLMRLLRTFPKEDLRDEAIRPGSEEEMEKLRQERRRLERELREVERRMDQLRENKPPRPTAFSDDISPGRFGTT